MKFIDYDESFSQVVVKLWRDTKFKTLNIVDKHSEEDYGHYLNNYLHHRYRIRLCLEADKVIGMIVYSKTEINQLYIDIDYQGKGIGRRLLDEAKEYCDEYLILHTFRVNTNAVMFYKNAGFKIIDFGSDNEEGLPDYTMKWQKNNRC